jgi:hypothetical protein
VSSVLLKDFDSVDGREKGGDQEGRRNKLKKMYEERKSGRVAEVAICYHMAYC